MGDVMNRSTLAAAILVAAMAACAQAADVASDVASKDVLDRPAIQSPIAAKKLLLAVTRAGDRLVAVGPRGHIVYSTDAGASWQQAQVPVSSDLTAVHFPSPKLGWAVGHDGVVLATTDGGATWAKQLDGRAVNDLILADVQAKLAAQPDSADLQALLAEAERSKEQGPDKPFLDVWFENDTTGYVAGAYNLLLKTTDAGKTWQSWFDRTENPRFMSFYAIRPAAGALYLAGEAGTVQRLDPATERFLPVPVDYAGSMFGIADAGSAVIVYGLRGNAFRSTDGGATWTKVDTMLPASIIGSAAIGNLAVLLADQGGRIALSNDGGVKFSLLPLQRTVPLTSIADAGGGRLAVTGPFGVMVVAPDAPR
jgi:photosystem II stability/assembly factor-like uncharacterized protein